MKALAFNGSPRGRYSNTDRILQPFLDGARKAGADTETVYLKEHEIRACLGCYTCWTRTPGVCVHRDDMPLLLEKMRQADVTVYATPLYVFTVSGMMKDFMDRHIPNLDPHIRKRGEHYIHPPRYEDTRWGRIVLISNCGFPERHHFDGLVETFRQMTQGPDSELTATILCTAGELLGQPALRDSVDWYLQAAHQAGREVVELGRISPETEAVLCRDLAEPEVFSRMANAHWDSLIVAPEASARAKVTEHGRPPPAAVTSDAAQGGNVRHLLEGMASSFNPARAGDLCAVLQFHVSGEDPGEYHFRIAEGTCTFSEGTASDATTTITTPSDVWISIARGKIGGAEAMMQGLYTVSGDFSLMLEMGGLFSGAEGGSAPVAKPSGPIAIPGIAWMTVSFVPWIACWVLGGLSLGALWGTSLSLVLSAAIWLYRHRFIETTWLDTGSVVYFAAAGVLALLDAGFWTTYGGVVGSLAMAGIWMATLATDTPLTADYSRWSYPPELARNPLFLKTNAVITAFWVAVFLTQTVISLVSTAHPAQSLLWTTVRYITLLPGAWFTAWFQKWYPAHVAAGT
jgi:putative sterol carrier protein